MNQVVINNEDQYFAYRMISSGNSKYYLGMAKFHEKMTAKDTVLNEAIAFKNPSSAVLLALGTNMNFMVASTTAPGTKDAISNELQKDLFNNRYDPHCLNNVKPAVMV